MEAPDRTDRVAYGRYLSVSEFDCYSCHSASFQKVDLMVPSNTLDKYPMNPAPMITDDEASAIWAYLQTVPEILNPGH